MKVEIILAIVWTCLCVCERQQRSTVLTDEYKRVLEHFDFSNFDKQEALNYIDRQRYENLIRGKRSHLKFKRDHGKTGKISGLTIKDIDLSRNFKNNEESNPNLNLKVCEKILKPRKIYVENFLSRPELETPNITLVRYKRGHCIKKKHRNKYQNELEEGEDEEEDEDEDKFKKRRRKKKKKKRKRHYWDHWSEWSPCSVTCGRGRKIRWRKCIVKNCTTGEFEMGEKTCQLPACNLLTKLLGL